MSEESATCCGYCKGQIVRAPQDQIAGWTVFYDRAGEADDIARGKIGFAARPVALCGTCLPLMQRQRAVFDTEDALKAFLDGTATEQQVEREQQAREARQQLVEEGKKCCAGCNTVLPLGAFQKDKRCLDGYKNTCKLCKAGASAGRARAA